MPNAQLALILQELVPLVLLVTMCLEQLALHAMPITLEVLLVLQKGQISLVLPITT
jgi:hypothetical protein